MDDLSNNTSISFDEWCLQKNIRFYKNALYHHILATRDVDNINKPTEWDKAWDELFVNILQNTTIFGKLNYD